MFSSLVLLLITYQLYINCNAFEQSLRLNSSRLSSDSGDITIHLTQNHVTTNNTSWHLNPTTQDGTDLTLKLTNQWGFHHYVASTINITMNGFTPNRTKEEGEFLMLFAVNNTQYFSLFISLEGGQAWRSYPSYQNQALATSDNIFGNIIASSTLPRYHKLANSSFTIDRWAPIGPGTHYKNALQWPLNIQITNDPMNQATYYQCFLPDKTLQVIYSTSFSTNQGMTIYIMNDASDNRPFDIHSIDVSYSYTTATPSSTPTQSPSIDSTAPTQSPSAITPTQAPVTPSPVIVIGPNVNTRQPTNDMEQMDETTTSNNIELSTLLITDNQTTNDQEHTNNTIRSSWIFGVIIAIFVLVVIGLLYFIYKRPKSNLMKKQAESESCSNIPETENIKLQEIHDLVANEFETKRESKSAEIPQIEGDLTEYI